MNRRNVIAGALRAAGALLLSLGWLFVGLTTFGNVVTWLGVGDESRIARDNAGAGAILTFCAVAIGADLERRGRRDRERRGRKPPRSTTE
jgi:hypothetical protein